MSDELEGLPANVREALDGFASHLREGSFFSEWNRIIRAELLRLARENAELRAGDAKLRSIIRDLQAIVMRWLPRVRDGNDPMNDQIGDDAFGLMCYDGKDQPQYGEQVYTRMERAESALAELRAKVDGYVVTLADKSHPSGIRYVMAYHDSATAEVLLARDKDAGRNDGQRVRPFLLVEDKA